MNILKVGDNAPDFSCKNQHGNTVNLSDMIGKKVVLFFYPKANTPGCTAEACNLNDNYNRFISEGYEIIVVGGGASNELLLPTHPNNIINTAYVISNAELYVGVDSSMMHMASMFLPGNKMHLYHTGAVEKSHHLLRNIDNGAVLNNYGLK